MNKTLKTAKAAVEPMRQRSQFTCMSCSMTMCLKALGRPTSEDEVNKVMGARPMQGASWEDAIASAQHYGMRVHLICPATLTQVKTWTDQGYPVMIAWNPEGRPWSHASVIFDVDDENNVWVADPNIPDPSQTVRTLPAAEFYKKWFENRGDYLVRRTALAVMPEITSDGRQVVASRNKKAYEVYVDAKGYAHDDEGNSWYVGMQYAGGVYGLRQLPGPGDAEPRPSRIPRPTYGVDEVQLAAIDALLAVRPNDSFISSLRRQVAQGKVLSEAQKKALRQNFYRNRMKDKADLFRGASVSGKEIGYVSINYGIGDVPENRQGDYGVSVVEPDEDSIVLKFDDGNKIVGQSNWVWTWGKPKETGMVQNWPQHWPSAVTYYLIPLLQQILKHPGRKIRRVITPRDAAYEGNPDGDPIYPQEIDHGYNQSLSGGTDVVQRLQNNLLKEQDRPIRPDTQRLAFRVANRFWNKGKK